MRERQGFLKHVVLLIGLLALLSLPSRSAVQHEGATHASLAYAGQNPAKTWYLLHLDLDPAWQTTITLTNLEAQQVQVTFSAYDQGGGFLGKIPAITSLEAEVTQTLEAEKVLPPGSETLKLESSGKLVGSALFKTLDGKKAEAIPAIQDASQKLGFPPLLQGDQDDKTITLLNTEPTSANLLVIALDQRGVELERTLLPPLPPMASHTFAVQDLFRSEILQQLATVRVISDRRLVGLQLVNPPYADLVGLPALTATSREWSFPIATQGGDVELWTAVGLFNPGEFSTSVTVEAFDAANTSLGIIDGATLLPGAIHFVITANLRGAIPSNAASLKVTSDQPITGYEVIGVVNGAGVTAALGIPEEDQETAGLEITGSQDGSVLSAWPMVRMGDGSIKSTAGSLGRGEWKEVLRITSIRAEPQALEGEVTTKKVGIVKTSSSTISPIFPVNGTLTGSDGKGWYHFPGSPYHFPSKGYADADDTYALDLNLSGDKDKDEWVIAIEEGMVKQVDTCSGWVLLEHTGKGTIRWKGRDYSTWYSGYAHMKNIQSIVKKDATISKDQKIGEISGMGKKEGKCVNNAYPNHLHFAIYVGKIVSTRPVNAFLESVDPGPTAGYSGLTYGEMESGGKVFNHNIDDKFTDAKHIFEKGGTSSDWYGTSLYGLYDHMYYTLNTSSTTDNWGRWKLDIPIPETTTSICKPPGQKDADGNLDDYDECYRIYALIPPNYANTTRATYNIYKNNTFLASKVINQNSYCLGSDCWVELGRFNNLNQGDKIEVYLDDKTGETNQSKYVGYDAIKILRKKDAKMYYTPTITIFTNKAAFTPGDTLTLSASITNPGPAIVVDIFTGFVLPDGSFLFIDPFLTLVPADASNSTTYTPIATSVTLPPGYELPKTPFYSVVLPSTVPPGTYYAFAALAEPGSAKKGSIKLIGDLSLAQFTFSSRPASPQISLSIEKQYYKVGETLIIDYTTVRGESNNTVDVYVTFEYLDKGYVAYYYYDPSDPDDDWFHRDASPYKKSWNVKDETGRFIEYTFKKETPEGNHQVQAFLTLPGAHPKEVLSKSNTVSFYVESETTCSATTALGSKTSSSSIKQKASLIEELNLLRRIRDEILAQTSEGKELIRLYYKHSSEIVWIFLTNPDLRKRSGNLLKQFITISSRESLDKGKIILPSSILKDIKPLLDDLAKESSLELQSNIDIWDKGLSLLESQGIVEIK